LKRDRFLNTGQPVFAWQNPRGALQRACRELRFPVYSTRALRRTLIIHPIEQGIDIRQIAQWQGHRDAKLILDTYGEHLSDERTASELKKLERHQGNVCRSLDSRDQDLTG